LFITSTSTQPAILVEGSSYYDTNKYLKYKDIKLFKVRNLDYLLQGPTWTLRCWSPAQLGKMYLCIIGSLWTGYHCFVSRFPSGSYMETSSLGRKLLSSSEFAPYELYCYIIIILNSF